MRFILACLAAVTPLTATQVDAESFQVEAKPIIEHDDGKFLWFHPRAAAIPDRPGHAVMTIQKHLHKSDFYSGLHVMYSTDNGGTWTAPEARAELAWRTEADGTTEGVCDVTPGWHEPSRRIIGFGVKVRYRDGVQVYDQPQSHAIAYTVHDPAAGSWSAWKFVAPPEPAGKFYMVGPGCSQWLVEDGGTLLLPVYFRGPDTEQYSATVMRLGFDGESVTYLKHGDELALDVDRGLVEPSLARLESRYFLTLRNDQKGYVTTSTDGLRWEPIKAWTFDDGEELGSYNTQQHWLTHGDRLYLAYTRRGANNDHIMRHRAPLFIAQVDPSTLQVIRASEKVLVPERGATLGNFGASLIGPDEAWVTVSEGIWSDDARKRGATGATWLARIRFQE